jgi:hypothetical protein
MDLSLITARVKEQLTALRSVGQSAELEAAADAVVALPAAFVLPMSDVASDLGMTGTTYQRVVQQFSVILVISNRRDAQGGAALNDLHTQRLALRAALVGWVPDTANGEPVIYTGGKLVKMDGDGRLWWADEFELTTFYWSP